MRFLAVQFPDMQNNIDMSMPVALRLGLLEDARHRDLVTARRSVLLQIVWQEGFLSSRGLIARTEALARPGCFGKSAAATFRRDIRALKAILSRAGFSLRFSRRSGRGGYYVAGRPELALELVQMIQSAMQDVDPKQVALAIRLTPAERVQQAGRLSDGLRRLAARRLMAERRGLGLQEAYREVTHRYTQLGG
jgi:hypothetical protein